MNPINQEITDVLAVIMATPELAVYCAESAPRMNLNVLDTLVLCAQATIPAGHRAGFMASALLYMKENELTSLNVEDYHFAERIDGTVFWMEKWKNKSTQ